jgi:hypothetical protein
VTSGEPNALSSTSPRGAPLHSVERSTSPDQRIVEPPGESEKTKPVDYALINAVYGALLAALLIAARKDDRTHELTEPRELLPLGAAAFALSKAVAREKVGSWMREPFVDEHAGSRRRPRGHGLRHAMGELVTCSRCVGAWSALGLVGLRLASPSAGRVATGVLATSALNDVLQAGFRALCEQANASR